MFNRVLRFSAVFIAIVLIPALLYISLRNPHPGQTMGFALWAPIIVIAIDALVFFFALGIWSLTAWERVGISIIVPLLIAIASWAAMMGMVSAQMPTEDGISMPNPSAAPP